MNHNIINLSQEIHKESKPKCVVRVKTSYWSDDRGIHIRKDLNFLKRKSTPQGIEFVKEDLLNSGEDCVVPLILNLNDVSDGVYQLMMVNINTDYWTGYIDDFDYKLIEYNEE